MDRKYKTPPIIEAVCEFKFDDGSPWDLTYPGLIYNIIESDFPSKRTVQGVNFKFESGQDSFNQNLSTSERSQFLKEDNSALIQVGQNLLSINKLQPYDSWQVYKPMIEQGLNAYREVIKTSNIQRIGLRYINKIGFKQDEFDGNLELKKFFKFRPHLGENIPLPHGNFIVSVVIPFDEEKSELKLQLSTGASEGDTHFLILDLDYYMYSPNFEETEIIFKWIEMAHSNIANVFEASITDELQKRFNLQKG